MREPTILGIGVAVVITLLGLSTLHVYWALGGEWAKGVVVPERDGQPVLRPGAGATAMIAMALLCAAGVLALRAGVLGYQIGGPLIRWASWLIAMVFFVRGIGDFRWVGLFRRERGTRFAYWDARLYTPLTLALALGAAAIARGAT
jgi:hypothetical protein